MLLIRLVQKNDLVGHFSWVFRVFCQVIIYKVIIYNFVLLFCIDANKQLSLQYEACL